MLTKVAGVTYNNEIADGGKNRQEILGGFLRAGKTKILVDLQYGTYYGKPAIKLREHDTQQVIGFIPKEDVHLFADKKVTQLVGNIGSYQHIYCQLNYMQ